MFRASAPAAPSASARSSIQTPTATIHLRQSARVRRAHPRELPAPRGGNWHSTVLKHRAEMGATMAGKFGNAGRCRARTLMTLQVSTLEGTRLHTADRNASTEGSTLHVGAKEVQLSRSRPRTYTRRCAGPRTAGPRGLHRRYRVQRRAPPRLGRPDLELDQSLRRNPQLGRRDNRPGTWTDHRQARRPRDETLLRIRHYRNAQAFRFLA